MPPYCGRDIGPTDDPVQGALKARTKRLVVTEAGIRSASQVQPVDSEAAAKAIAARTDGPVRAVKTVEVPAGDIEKRRALLSQGFHYRRHAGNGEKWRRLRQGARQAGKRWRREHPDLRDDQVAVRVAGQEWYAAQVFPPDLSERGRSILLDCWRGDSV